MLRRNAVKGGGPKPAVVREIGTTGKRAKSRF